MFRNLEAATRLRLRRVAIPEIARRLDSPPAVRQRHGRAAAVAVTPFATVAPLRPGTGIS
jgi:hypothetical protein